LRIKEQETHLTLQEHDDDDDDEKVFKEQKFCLFKKSLGLFVIDFT